MNYWVEFYIRGKKLTWTLHDCMSLDHAKRKFEEQFKGDLKVTRKGKIKVFGKVICSDESCVKMPNYWFTIIQNITYSETQPLDFDSHETL